MADQRPYLLLTFFGIDRLGAALDWITYTVKFCAEPSIPERVQRFLLATGRERGDRFRQYRKSTPNTGETAVFRKAAKLDRAVTRA